MLSETLAAGLQAYGIGRKIRTLRLDKKLGLNQLGEHTGLSPAMLSKIERGQLFPTLPTLLRIAMVFGVGLEHFFLDTRKRRLVSVIRKADRLRLPNSPQEEQPSYFFESLDFPVTGRKMEAFFAHFPIKAKLSDLHQHNGVELIYVISGQLAMTIDEQNFVLGEGDAIYFDSSAPHSYRQEGQTNSTAIVVVAPP